MAVVPYERNVRISQSLLSEISDLTVNVDGEAMDIRSVQSSPGYLQVGQVPSNWTRQIPQTSSSGISQRHVATAFHCFIVTFMMDSGTRRLEMR